MKTVTESLDDDACRLKTAEQSRREERTPRERITAFRASDRLSREDVHERCE